MTNVYTPGKQQSVQHISPTKEERQKDAKAFRAQKERERKIKDERFAEIRERRKNNPSGGGGINIDVTSE